MINFGADRLGTSGTIKVFKELLALIDNPPTNIITNSNSNNVLQLSQSLYDDNGPTNSNHNIISSTLFFIVGSHFVKFFLSKK
jgi:hypothetical protein